MIIKNNQDKSVYERIYDQVRRIPYGRVSTYGRIAGLAGGATARMVGYAMASLPDDSDVPWQRVINREGKVSPRKSGSGEIIQRKMLELEGVEFNDRDSVDLKIYLWQP